MTYSRMTLAAVIAAFATGAVADQSQINQIRADLSAKGFTDIEIDVKGDRIFVEADKGRRDFEVIYNRNTGSIISQGYDDERPSTAPSNPQVTAAYENLAARGLRDIDVDVKGDRIIADGELNGRDYEVVFDAATGAVISEGYEQDSGSSASQNPNVAAAYDDLAARGLRDIDVDVEGDRIIAEGERNGRDYEVVYDAATGDVISEGYEQDTPDNDRDDQYDDDRDDDDDDRDDRDDDDDDRDDDDHDDDDDDDDDDDRDDD